MSERQAVLVKDGLPFGGAVLGENGQQVLLPLITEIDWAAAPRKGGHGCPTIKLTVAMPADACPVTDDVSWMRFVKPDGTGGKLRDIKVVLVFEPDTLILPD